jgi:hypothetical protein
MNKFLLVLGCLPMAAGFSMAGYALVHSSHYATELEIAVETCEQAETLGFQDRNCEQVSYEARVMGVR